MPAQPRLLGRRRRSVALGLLSSAHFVVSLALVPRLLRALGPRRTMVIGLVVLATGHLWLGHAPAHAGYLVAVLPGLLLVAISFTSTTRVIASAAPDAHAGLVSGLAGSTSQVGAALGTATLTAIGIAQVARAPAP